MSESLSVAEYHALKSKRSKYHNRRTRGFASKREADRYQQLVILERAGQIQDLRCQHRWPIIVNGKPVCVYVSDFDYIENGTLVVEDAKGFRTPVYRLKKKLFEAVYGHEILET